MAEMVDTSDLDSNETDKKVFLLKSAVKTILPIPVVGDVLGEIIVSCIPNQQMERVANCIREIAKLVERNSSEIKRVEEFLDMGKSNAT